MSINGRAAANDDLLQTLELAADQAKILCEHTTFYLIQMAIDDLHDDERLRGLRPPPNVLRPYVWAEGR